MARGPGISINKFGNRADHEFGLRKAARERLRLPSFWVDKPRDGFTETCAELAPLMNAGPCGTYRPAFDVGSAPDLSKKKPVLGIQL